MRAKMAAAPERCLPLLLVGGTDHDGVAAQPRAAGGLASWARVVSLQGSRERREKVGGGSPRPLQGCMCVAATSPPWLGRTAAQPTMAVRHHHEFALGLACRRLAPLFGKLLRSLCRAKLVAAPRQHEVMAQVEITYRPSPPAAPARQPHLSPPSTCLVAASFSRLEPREGRSPNKRSPPLCSSFLLLFAPVVARPAGRGGNGERITCGGGIPPLLQPGAAAP